jgi:hypothetical protein
LRTIIGDLAVSIFIQDLKSIVDIVLGHVRIKLQAELLELCDVAHGKRRSAPHNSARPRCPPARLPGQRR